MRLLAFKNIATGNDCIFKTIIGWGRCGFRQVVELLVEDGTISGTSRRNMSVSVDAITFTSRKVCLYFGSKNPDSLTSYGCVLTSRGNTLLTLIILLFSSIEIILNSMKAAIRRGLILFPHAFVLLAGLLYRGSTQSVTPCG